MRQREIEVILTRQLASYLALPIFIVDEDGTLIFYNEPAEAILGQRFEETGEMPADEWAQAYTDHGRRRDARRAGGPAAHDRAAPSTGRRTAASRWSGATTFAGRSRSRRSR